MYEGDDVEDEAKQNALDQMFPLPRTEPLEVTPPVRYTPPAVEKVLGLSTRQKALINNDDPLKETGAARERRLQIIHRDIDAINKFLPYLDQVRGFMSTMPTDEDEGLVEALALSDMKLRQFISEINAKLASLEQELELKKVIV